MAGEKIEIYKDKGDEYRFRLKSENGNIIVSSEGYSSKQACINGVEAMRRLVSTAAIHEVKK